MNILKDFIVILLVCTHLFLVIGCNNDNPSEADEKDQPALPPENSMKVDLSAFTGNDNSLEKSMNNVTKLHFTTAAILVTGVNLWVALGLAAPVGLFAAAINEKPELKSDGKFHWEFSSAIGIITYTADLAGWIDVDSKQSVWEMYVSSGQQLDHFNWYDGRCNLDLTAGNWTFYDAKIQNEQNETIRIDWVITNDSTRTLTFTNVIEGNEYEGDTLVYSVNGRNLSVSRTSASDSSVAIIAWDAVTTAGYIQMPGYNNGEAGHWDENHDDIL